jgi:hypothetical protein
MLFPYDGLEYDDVALPLCHECRLALQEATALVSLTCTVPRHPNELIAYPVADTYEVKNNHRPEQQPHVVHQSCQLFKQKV